VPQVLKIFLFASCFSARFFFGSISTDSAGKICFSFRSSFVLRSQALPASLVSTYRSNGGDTQGGLILLLRAQSRFYVEFVFFASWAARAGRARLRSVVPFLDFRCAILISFSCGRSNPDPSSAARALCFSAKICAVAASCSSADWIFPPSCVSFGYRVCCPVVAHSPVSGSRSWGFCPWKSPHDFLLPICFCISRFSDARVHWGIHRFLLARWEASSFPLSDLSLLRSSLQFPSGFS
jgi:hypothetical protein